MNKVSNLGKSLLANSHSHAPSALSSSLHQPTPQTASAGTPSTPSSGAPSASSSSAAAAQAKQAFLAPFELFYDAVHDARQLKDWFNDQLTRTAVLMRRWEEQQNQQQQRSASADTRTRGGRTKEDSLVKREEAEAEGPVEELGIKEEIERLRRRVEELEGRLGARDGVSPSAFVNGSNGGGTLGTASSSGSSSSSHEGSNNEGYTFPPSGPGEGGIGVHQQQPREYPYQQQRQEKGELEQRQDYHQPSGSKSLSNPSLAFPPGRENQMVRGRPELGRRLSSPGWHPSSSRGATRTGYRVVGRGGGGDGPLDREKERDDRLGRESREGGTEVVGVSKSLSGPGAPGSPGNGSQFSNGLGSNSRRGRERRVSISGEVVPTFGPNTREGHGEPIPAAGRKSMRTEEREGRRPREKDKRTDEADVDAGSISGGDGDRAREGAREPVRERKIDRGKEHENDRIREEGRR